MSWSSSFHEPITLPNGTRLATLADALAYIHSLPAETQEEERWRLAARTLRRAEKDVEMWLDFARLGVMQALAVPHPVSATAPRRPSRRRR